MLQKSLNTLLISGATLVLFSGCAAKETTNADLMRTYASKMAAKVEVKQDLAEDWEKGAAMLKQGKKQAKEGQEIIDKANDNLKKGQQMLEEGNKNIADGKMLIQKTELQYKENFPANTLIQSK